MKTFDFHKIGRLPEPGDNVAIATYALETGTKIRFDNSTFEIDSHVMEGHRFAIEAIDKGSYLYSWRLPFGRALRPIAAGGYVCNQEILDALSVRQLDVLLPTEPNFEDWHEQFALDRENFEPGEQAVQVETSETFHGYARNHGRGVGTRNYIVVLGTSRLTSGYVRMLAERLQRSIEPSDSFDGIVHIAHTEGSGTATPNNLQMVLRTLAGLVVHPNVGAILAVDSGGEAVNNRLLAGFMETEAYPLQGVLHHFMSVDRSFEEALAAGEKLIRSWAGKVQSMRRSAQPLSQLKLALQCGGSDAFSGISGNPLAAWIAHKAICCGGSANLAETDELIGAEPYLLQNVRDLQTAEQFLAMVEHFKTWSAWHGNSADSNPSGGNKLRGIYNIVLKSIGAARKRHPAVRLDYAIEYGAPMKSPGYYFMDSPGNDLESIAGQVAGGCNLIFFVTGNGSITNFPIAPTIKIVTTTKRHAMLSNEMDVNAGAYLDGTPMEDLGKKPFELSVAVASGKRTLGETAGHAQVQLWRNWRQTDDTKLVELQQVPRPSGEPISVVADHPLSVHCWSGLRSKRGMTIDQVGLIVPTSLCSSQIARMTAESLTAKKIGCNFGISRFVALVHTEGCGVSAGYAEDLQLRTLASYLNHAMVRRAFLIEHGCEKTHNDYLRIELEKRGRDPQEFGWASIQLDGGIQAVMQKVEDWFLTQLAVDTVPEECDAGVEHLRIGIVSSGNISSETAVALREVTASIVCAGGTVVVPDNTSFANTAPFSELYATPLPALCLSYGEQPNRPGFHLMDAPTEDWVETITGLGATGVDIIVGCLTHEVEQGHPLLPVLRVTSETEAIRMFEADIDLWLEGDAGDWGEQLLGLIVATASRRYQPKVSAQRNTDFQLTRGLLGTSA